MANFPTVASSNSGSRLQISGTNCNVPVPTGVTAGDTLVMLMSASSVTPALVAGGWTTLYSSGSYAVQWKIADSGDAAASNFPVAAFLGNSNTESCECVILRISGADGTTPVNNSSFAAGSTTTPSTTAISPATLQCLFIDFVLHQASAVRTVSTYAIASNNPSWTEVQDASNQGSSGTIFSGAAAAWANQTASPGVSTGAVSATISGAVTSNLIGLIAIQPAKITPTTLTAASAVGAAVAQIRSLVSSIIATATVGSVTVSATNTWTNSAKNATTWTDTTKL